jgi:L-malate glycosyltransferase
MRRNILQLIGSFHQGGSEHQAIQLTQSLHASGRYSVHVACLDPRGVLREEIERLNLGEISEYPLTSFYNLNAATQLRRFAAELRKRRIDIVQTHDFYTNVFGMAGATLARIPARIAAKRETSGVRTGAQRMAEQLSYQLAHAVVANAEAVKRFLVADGVPEGKIVTVYNGLDAARFEVPEEFSRNSALKSLGLPAEDGRRFVTLVANLRHTVKDHPTFLRAASRVYEAMPNASFVLAGEGELTASMRELADSLGLAGCVFFIGRCSQVNLLLAVSDVCVLSSTAEGFSNVILEYMAAGRPVVTTDVGGAREVVDEGVTGFLVTPKDDASIAERIIELLKDPERALAMGGRGRSLVREQFSREAQLQKTEQLYDDLLSGEKAKIVRNGRLSPTGS